MGRVSLVVLTYNRAKELSRTLERALALPERAPVIVVDNCSTDATPALLASRFAAAETVRLPRNIGAAGRNAGAERARTPYVAFSDDDSAWEAGSLARAAELLDRHPRAGALMARVLVGEEGREDPACREMAASPLSDDGLPGPALLGFLACAVVFRREAFRAAGGYEPRFFVGGEETLLAYDLAALGRPVAYAPALTVRHHPSPSRDAAARRRLMARNAIWTALLRRSWRAAFREVARSPLPAIGDALRGAGWALANRRPLPPHLQALCERVH